MPALEDYIIFDSISDDQDDGAEADMNNLDTTIQVSHISTIRIHKDHPLNQVIGDLQSATQTRNISKNLKEHGFISTIQQRINHKDLQNCLFACFLSQEEPKKVIYALKDPSWIEAIQEELLQFKLQEVWTLVELPNGKRAIGTKWVFGNKKDERGIMIRNKARLIEEDVYVCNHQGIEDQYFLDRVYIVILNGDGSIQVTTDEKGVEIEVPPKTAQALLQRQRERKAKSILLLAILDEYQLRFHGIKDAKSLWAAIKSRFGGNVESKKMQKTVLKQQFENFYVFDTEGLDKAYDRFQKLISLLEVHGAAVPNEDANQKFLRALPSSWNNVALIMRNKDGIDDLDIDDLYNNLKVFEADIKGSSGSSSNSQNVAFLSTEDTSSSNEVNTANGSNSPQLDDEDLEQIDHDDLEVLIKLRLNALTVIGGAILVREMLEHQESTNMNIDAGYRSMGGEEGGKKERDNTRRTVPVETSDALVVQDNALIVQDGLGYDWNETLREKDDLKANLEQFETSSKNLNKLINSKLSSKDKTGLGYGDQLNENDSSGSELFNSVFDSRSSDGDDNQTNDRFKKDNGYHAVPPPLTGKYMPPLTDL
ncbi:ribonuclease H-like domain-containing protein [Tanacetum coccineum]